MTFDLTTVYNIDRPLSWSGISSFEWRPSGWYEKYVVHGKCTYDKPDKGIVAFCVLGMGEDCPVVKKTPELVFGSYVDKKIQEDHKFLKELVRYPIMQHEMVTEYHGIPLIGYADTFTGKIGEARVEVRKGEMLAVGKPSYYAALRDYKTGRKPWDQKRANETGQITMYEGMLYQIDKIRPEEIEAYIDWLPTHIHEGKVEFIKEGDIRTFKTKRTMTQVLQFFKRIEDTWAAMEDYASRMENTELKEW